VFDKLQRGGNPAQSQTSPDCPNILLLSCFPVHSAPLPFSPGLGWALDELFSGQPNMGAVKQMPDGWVMRPAVTFALAAAAEPVLPSA
jgi:hypothetical protein